MYPSKKKVQVPQTSSNEDEYEWVYYNAMDCKACQQQNQIMGYNSQKQCNEDSMSENGALGAEYLQEWEYYDEMPADEEEFYYDPVLGENIPQESMAEHQMLVA